MLICKEQQNPIIYENTEIRITDRAANAMYILTNLPLTSVDISVYLGYKLGDKKNDFRNLTAKELSKLIEDCVKEEFLNLCSEEMWNEIGKL